MSLYQKRLGLDSLIGKKITEFSINQQKTAIKFKADGVDMCFEFDADCCSETWVEHLSFNKWESVFTINKIEQVKMEALHGTRQEVDELYGVIFKIDESKYSDLYIEFRNSSNGYYGGSINLYKWEDIQTLYKEDTFVEVKEGF